MALGISSRYNRLLVILLLLVTTGSAIKAFFSAGSNYEPAVPFFAPLGGKAKAAYRNYYLGNFYFGEGQVNRARNNFRQAYSAFPEQPTFGLAYALCLGETGDGDEGIEVVKSIRLSLRPGEENYRETMVMLEYVESIVRTRAQQFGRALPLLRRAYRQQMSIDSANWKRLAGMRALEGYLEIMHQESPVSHAGLDAHVHVDQKSLELALPKLVKSMELDSGRTDVRSNLRMVTDTLGRQPQLSFREAGPRAISTADHIGTYPHLPYRMDGVIPFGAYDEVLFLVDISGSMVMEQVACSGVDRFTIMREAGQFLIDQLEPETRVGLATIGGDCGSEPKWWISTDSLTHRELQWQIRHLNPDGTTPLLTTLVEAPALFSEDTEATKGIFFISDGENVCGLGGLDICEWAAGLSAQNITLNVLTFLDHGLSNSGAFAEYACLTDRSGGEVRYLDPITCSIDDFTFDLVDRVHFELPALERVNCRRGQSSALWAIFPED